MTSRMNGNPLEIKSVFKRRSDDLQGRNGKDKALNIKIYKDEDSLFELSEEWGRLAEQTKAPVFMSPEWTRCWWQYFGKNEQRSLQIVTIWDEQKMIAIAPLYEGWSSIGNIVIERRLQIIGSGGSPNEQLGFLDDYGISDFLDFLVDKEYEDRAANIFVNYIKESNADVITLHQAGDDSFLMRKLYPEMKGTGIRSAVRITDKCPFIDISGHQSLSSYIKEMKSNARRRFRQTLRATGPGKEFVVENLETADDVDNAIDILIKLHQNRWNELGFPGVFHDDRFTRFFRKIVHHSLQNKTLWFKQARDEDGICAARLILLYNGRYYDYISGFDAERPSSKYRPGIGLLLNLIEDAVKSDIDRVELLRGEEGYKFDFTDNCFRNWKITIKGANNRKGLRAVVSLIVRMQALIYKYYVRETTLLNVQKEQVGIMRMFQAYFRFRWTSLKLKLNSD